MYTEERSVSYHLRQGYLDEVYALIEARSKESIAKRDAFITPESLAANPEGYRQKFHAMLGWPMTSPRPTTPPQIEKTFLAEDSTHTIYRLRLTVLEKLHLNTLLFIPRDLNDSEQLPGIICQHGGLGSPELISGIWGDTFNYNSMGQRVLSHRCVVIAPQLLLWPHDGTQGDPVFDRQRINTALRHSGSSIMGLETYALTMVLDYLESLPMVDASRLGMVGLSYGGYYTILTAAADRRIKSALSSCSFCGHYPENPKTIHDWCFTNGLHTFMDSETAALIAPRALAIQVGDKDELFDHTLSQAEYARLFPFYQVQNATEMLSFRIFDGSHEFWKGSDDLDFFFNHL